MRLPGSRRTMNPAWRDRSSWGFFDGAKAQRQVLDLRLHRRVEGREHGAEHDAREAAHRAAHDPLGGAALAEGRGGVLAGHLLLHLRRWLLLRHCAQKSS